jgi:integrase
MDALSQLANEEGLSAQTKAHTLQAVRQFGRWLVKDQWWASNLFGFLTVPAASIRADQRHERRAFSIDELTQLIKSTKIGEMRRNLTGPERAMLYAVAVGTGLRVGELAALTPDCFQDGWVTLEPSETKNSLEATLPLPESLWRTLEPWLETRPAKKRLWVDGLYRDRAIFSKCLKFDMAVARAEWIANGGNPQSEFLLWCDSKGRYADGHAFRTTFVSLLAQSGISPKELQRLDRHSDPKTTLRHYAKLSDTDLERAVKCLPDLTPQKNI